MSKLSALPIEDLKLVAWHELLQNESVTTYEAVHFDATNNAFSTIFRKFDRFGKAMGIAGTVPYWGK